MNNRLQGETSEEGMKKEKHDIKQIQKNRGCTRSANWARISPILPAYHSFNYITSCYFYSLIITSQHD